MIGYRVYRSAALAMAVFVAACGGRETPPAERVTDTVTVIKEVPASNAGSGGTAKASPAEGARQTPAEPRGGSAKDDGKNDIVPGARVGGVKIGENMKDVTAALGEPDSSEGAMGHVWAWWLSHRSDAARQELGVYAGFDNDATGHYVRQIRLTSPYFVTASGISTRSSLADVLRAFKGARAVAKYNSPQRGGTVYLYDDKAKGIAFEVFQGSQDPASGTCIAIVVHAPGADPTSQYLGARDYTPIGGSSAATGGKR